jgi:hypothetical protein
VGVKLPSHAQVKRLIRASAGATDPTVKIAFPPAGVRVGQQFSPDMTSLNSTSLENLRIEHACCSSFFSFHSETIQLLLKVERRSVARSNRRGKNSPQDDGEYVKSEKKFSLTLV